MSQREMARQSNSVSSYKGGRIPQRLLESAKQEGNVKDVADLLMGLNKTNYRLEVLDVLFYHLQAQLLEPPRMPSALKPIFKEKEMVEDIMLRRAETAAFCASNGFFAALLWLPDRLRQQAYDKIVSRLDDYMAWANYLLSDPIPQEPDPRVRLADPDRFCSSLLRMLEDGMEPLAGHIRSSQTVIDYAISVWTAKDSLTGEAFLIFDDRNACSTVHLFGHFLADEEGLERVFDTLFKPRTKGVKLWKSVVEGAISRCRRVTKLTRKEVEAALHREAVASGQAKSLTSPLLVVFKQLRLLRSVVQRLCLNDHMAASFLRSTFFGDFTEALSSWILKKSRRERDRMDRYVGFDILVIIGNLLEALTREKGYRHLKLCGDAWIRVVRAGYLDVLVEGMHSISSRDEDHEETIWSCLEHMRTACNQHPSLAPAMNAKLMPLLGKQYWRTQTFSHTGWTDCWTPVALDVAAGSLVYSGVRSFNLCDNVDCPRDPSARSSSWVCSGCRGQTYCSRACQKADWTKVHREECSRMRDSLHEGQVSKMFHYGHSLRQHHALLAAHRAILEIAESDSLESVLNAKPSILVFDEAKDPQVHDAQDYLCPKMSDQDSDGYWDRFHDLADKFVRGGFEEGQRLVEISYPVGSETVRVVSMYRPLESGAVATAPGERGEVKGMRLCTISSCVTELSKAKGGSWEDFSGDELEDEWIDSEL